MGEKVEFTKWWILMAVLGGITLVAITLGSYFGLWGKTWFESVIFKESHQYKDARRDAIGTFDAQLVEVERLLSSNIDDERRTNLEAQAAALRVMMATERSKQ